MTLLIVFLTLALGVSFLCSILEAILLSVTPSYIAKELEQGRPNGKRWQKTKQNIDRSLAAILSLNTIAHTVGAAGVGAQAGKVFGEAYFGVISAVLTLLILVLSEIIPKTLGAMYWRQLAPPCAQVLKIVEILMLPLVLFSQGITKLFSAKHQHGTVSPEEISALAWAGENQGILSSEESAVIRSIVHFRHLTAKDIMTPRTVIFCLDDQATVAEAFATKNTKKFSRIPIYDQHPDKIHAFVRKDDILFHTANGDSQTILRNLKRPLLTVLSGKSLLSLWRDMTVDHFHMVLVVNEYGDVLGLLTMEDLVETMLGLEIVDETDNHPNMQRLARNLWEKRAREMGSK